MDPDSKFMACESMCEACPFSMSETSQYVQNLGCLPDIGEIIELMKKTRMNWSCHDKDGKLCAGYATWMMDLGIYDKSWPMFSTDAYLKEGLLLPVERYTNES